MGEEITCCFTGHRPHRLPWHEGELDPRCQRFRAELDRQVAMAYDRGYRHFISGMAQGGDLMFCEAVLKLREAHPDVVLEAAVPYPGQADRWKAAQQERYRRLLERLRTETVSRQPGETVWLCRNCGHLVLGDSAPQVCPVCGHPQGYFERRAENY